MYQTAPLVTAPRLVDDSQIAASKVNTKAHPAEVLVLDSAPPKVNNNADSLQSELPQTGHGAYLSAIPAPASDDMDEEEDKLVPAVVAPALIKENDVRFSEFLEMDEGSRGAPADAEEPEKVPAPAHAEAVEASKEQKSDPIPDIDGSGRESVAAVGGVAAEMGVAPEVEPAPGQAASEEVEPPAKTKAPRKARKKVSDTETVEPAESETASRNKKRPEKAAKQVAEAKEPEVRSSTPAPEAAKMVGPSEPASSSPIGGKRRKGKNLEVWSDDESGEEKVPTPKPAKMPKTAERPPAPPSQIDEIVQEREKEKPKKKVVSKSGATTAVSAATPGPQTRVSPRKASKAKAATTERDLFSVPSSATDVVVRNEKAQEKSAKRWVLECSCASQALVLNNILLFTIQAEEEHCYQQGRAESC